jgi:small subunit ribosomal protein S18
MKGVRDLDKGFMTSYAIEIDPARLPAITTELGYSTSVVRYAVFSLDSIKHFMKFENVQEAIQPLVEADEWVMKKNLTIFKDKVNDQYFIWKSTSLLKKFMTRFGDIKPRKYTGVTVTQQKKIRIAIIRARELGMLPHIK